MTTGPLGHEPVAARPMAGLARRPVFTAVVTSGAVLVAASGGYGYHRDELYFRLLKPAWGYLDEPPLTPLLAHLFSRLADSPWALRIPATVATVTSIYVVALITREVGGSRGAQALCAWGYGFAVVPMVMGHALLTSTIDLPVWPAVLLFIMRARLRNEPRWWLAAGLVVGSSTYNKLLVAVLLAAVAAGLVLAGQARALRSRWVLGAAAVALTVAAPNLIYQGTHGWPQLDMGRSLAAHNAAQVRSSMWWFLLVMLGPPLVPIWVAGLITTCRRPSWQPIRFLTPAFPVLLGIVFIMGSQNYYPFGIVAVLFALGCAPAREWAQRSHRVPVLVAAVAVNAAVTTVIALPLIPVRSLGRTPIASINQVAADSVGWPTYVEQIADAHSQIAPTDRSATVIIASNYGEAGAIDRYGPELGLPKAYSGHNQLYYLRRPPASAQIALIVGGQERTASMLFETCTVVGHLDNRIDVDNEEQDQPIGICTNPVGGWNRVWPRLRHQD